MSDNECAKSSLIWVNDFSEASAKEFCQKVIEASAEDTNAPITIYIDSDGGEADALSAMVGCMDSVPNPFVTVCVGKAYSAGALLLSHGHFRYVGPTARIMVHEISCGAIGHIDDVRTRVREMERLNNFWMSWLADNCNIKGGHQGLKKKLSGIRDQWMDVGEALKFGIVDSIGIPRIMKKVQYEVVVMPELLKRTQDLKPKGK